MPLHLLLLPLALARPVTDSCTTSVDLSSDQGVVTWRTRSCEHRVLSRFEGDRQLFTVYRLQADVKRSSALDGTQDARVKVTALDLPATGKVLWAVEDAGDRAWLWRDTFWVTTRYGCCAALDFHTVHALSSGRTLFHVSGDLETGLARVEIPNSRGLVRVAGLFGGGTGEDERVFGDGGALAWITWSSDTEALQRLAVLPASGAAPRSGEFGVPTLSWLPPADARDGVSTDGREVTLWSANGARSGTAVTGLTLRVTLLDLQVLDVPVRDGRLDARAATVPPGLRLVEIPAE